MRTLDVVVAEGQFVRRVLANIEKAGHQAKARGHHQAVAMLRSEYRKRSAQLEALRAEYRTLAQPRCSHCGEFGHSFDTCPDYDNDVVDVVSTCPCGCTYGCSTPDPEDLDAERIGFRVN